MIFTEQNQKDLHYVYNLTFSLFKTIFLFILLELTNLKWSKNGIFVFVRN